MKLSAAAKQKRIKQLIAKWRPVLFLGEWTIDHKFVNEQPEGEIDGSQKSAEIWVNYPYKTANIKTYKGFWEASKEEQDSILCHELCHCHTQELWDFCGDFANGKHHTPESIWRAVETLTQRISIIAKFGNRK